MSLHEDGGTEGTQPRRGRTDTVYENTGMLFTSVGRILIHVPFLVVKLFHSNPEEFHLSTYNGGKISSTFQKSVLNKKHIGTFFNPKRTTVPDYSTFQ